MYDDRVTTVDREALEHFADLARVFSKRSIGPMFEGEHADGDFSHLPAVYSSALDLGIATSTDPEMPGHDFGIWGKASAESRDASLLLLGIIAETCGGVAMALNMHGAAVNVLLSSGNSLPFKTRRPVLCLQEGPWPPDRRAIRGTGMETVASVDGDGFIINGKKTFCYGMGDADAWIVFARLEEGPACFAVSAGGSGIHTSDAGPRTGLRACSMQHVEFRNVRVPGAARIDGGDGSGTALGALTLAWLGMAAVASGIARGALEAAKKYAGERYQGGTVIARHPIIKKLLGGAEAALFATASSMGGAAPVGDCTKDAGNALMLKTEACGRCGDAVTDCLQVFGGYGYMEDFGMEKRLRDIAALRCTLGSPVYAEQWIGDWEDM